MKQSNQYTLVLYFTLMLLVMLTFSKCKAADTSSSSVDIIDISHDETSIVVRCHGSIFTKRLNKNALDSSLKELNAWASEQCFQAVLEEEKDK